MGYHRDRFYEVRRAFQVGGVGALACSSPSTTSGERIRVSG